MVLLPPAARITTRWTRPRISKIFRQCGSVPAGQSQHGTSLGKPGKAASSAISILLE